MRDSTILFKYHIHLRYHPTDKSGQQQRKPFSDHHLAPLQNSLGAHTCMVKASVSACLMTSRGEEEGREGSEEGKHIFIGAQLHHCVLSYTHNFQISAFALHIKIFLYVNEAFSYANP